MLCVKTIVKKSEISGLGLFADEKIKKGTIIWQYESTIDLLLTETLLNRLPAIAQERIRNYTYFDPYHKKYILCGDDARFFNHSLENNCDDSEEDITVAIRDIELGEELTVNYNEVLYGRNKELYRTINFTPFLHSEQIST